MELSGAVWCFENFQWFLKLAFNVATVLSPVEMTSSVRRWCHADGWWNDYYLKAKSSRRYIMKIGNVKYAFQDHWYALVYPPVNDYQSGRSSCGMLVVSLGPSIMNRSLLLQRVPFLEDNLFISVGFSSNRYIMEPSAPREAKRGI